MIFLGHIGITACAVQANNRWSARKLDHRKAALLSVAPDLIDKPLGLLFPAFFGYHTRLYAHSLAGAAAALVLLALGRRTFAPPWAYALAWLGHPLLDRMWVADRERLFWPLLGTPPPLPPLAIEKFFVGGFRPHVLVAEAVGTSLFLALLFYFRLYRRERLAAFLITGLLER